MATEKELIERFEAWRKPRNRFMTYTRNERYHLEKDKCIIKLDVTEDDLNPFDAIHGGALCNLMDNAAGMCVHTDGRIYVTQGSTFQFIRNQGVGTTVYATGTVRHRGRTACLIHVEVTNEEGKLLATGEFTMFCIGDMPVSKD